VAKRREGEALERARGELLAIIGELRPIKRRVCTIVRRLKAAANGAQVVAVDTDGERHIVEAWMAAEIDPRPLSGCGGAVLELLDELLRSLAHVADVERMRAEALEALSPIRGTP
jgi:hypothetical protein